MARTERRPTFPVVHCTTRMVIRARLPSTDSPSRPWGSRRTAADCVVGGRGHIREGRSSTMETRREFKVVGTRPIRHDGIDKVTGRARYGADIALPGMLHGKVLRSPHAHARIVSIDVS